MSVFEQNIEQSVYQSMVDPGSDFYENCILKQYLGYTPSISYDGSTLFIDNQAAFFTVSDCIDPSKYLHINKLVCSGRLSIKKSIDFDIEADGEILISDIYELENIHIYSNTRVRFLKINTVKNIEVSTDICNLSDVVHVDNTNIDTNDLFISNNFESYLNMLSWYVNENKRGSASKSEIMKYIGINFKNDPINIHFKHESSMISFSLKENDQYKFTVF